MKFVIDLWQIGGIASGCSGFPQQYNWPDDLIVILMIMTLNTNKL
jgi:hypothetical protein